MHKATLPVLFFIYLILFFIAFNPMKEGKIPVFNFSVFIMILIFWASYFILKKNIFEPLLKVLKEREDYSKEREAKYEEALAFLRENQEKYDKEINHFKEKERQSFLEFSKKLKEEQQKELENFKKELDEKLKISIKKFQKETEEAKELIKKNTIYYSQELVRRILKKDVE